MGGVGVGGGRGSDEGSLNYTWIPWCTRLNNNQVFKNTTWGHLHQLSVIKNTTRWHQWYRRYGTESDVRLEYSVWTAWSSSYRNGHWCWAASVGEGDERYLTERLPMQLRRGPPSPPCAVYALEKDIMRERTTEKGTFLGWGQILFSILFHNWRFCRRLNSCSICYRDRHLVLSAGTTWIDRNLNDRTLSLNYAFEYKHQICPTRHWCFFCCFNGEERKGSGHLVTFV